MRLFSPAKINLFFRILAKRSDGYHEIASLLQAIDLFDEITLERSDSDLFTCSDPGLPLDATNLVIKARELFRHHFGKSCCVKIHLQKCIPVQAGLGGGSSNAATILWGLNELAGKVASDEQLLQLGKELGSDVPFFFSLGRAHCSGRGEKVHSMPPLDGTGFLAKPSIGLSTADVYKCVQVPAEQKEKKEFFNDLEEAAFFLQPELRQFKDKLQTYGFDHVGMTGSGTAFFCLGNPIKIDPNWVPFRCIRRKAHCWYEKI